jgi:hypothetical protein
MTHSLFLAPLLSLLTLCGTVVAEDFSPTLFLIGDSTVTNQPVIPAQPGRGWGQLMPLYLKPGIALENHASSGQSSKSFMNHPLAEGARSTEEG